MGVHFDIISEKVLKKFKLVGLTIETGSESVSAFGIESRLADGIVCGWGANSILDVEWSQ